MNTTLRFVVDTIQEGCLRPAHLIRNVKDKPQLQTLLKTPRQTVSSSHRIHWERWDNSSLDKNYSLTLNDRYRIRHQYIPALEHIVRVKKIEPWHGDIRDIECLGASKSDLSLYKNLDDFATSASPNLIADVCDENLRSHLNWEGGRILNNPLLCRYAWDNNRIHLCNSGSSHHFSAARYLSLKLTTPIPVSGRLYAYHLNEQCVFTLTKQFNLFSVLSKYSQFIIDECEHFGAPVGSYPAPQPFYDQTIIFLPRNNIRSMRISKLFKQIQLFDFSLFLLNSLNKQAEPLDLIQS